MTNPDTPEARASITADNDAGWNLARLAVECGAEDNATDGQRPTWTLDVAAFTKLARRLRAPAVVDEAMVERAHAAYGDACLLGARSTKIAMKYALAAAMRNDNE